MANNSALHPARALVHFFESVCAKVRVARRLFKPKTARDFLVLACRGVAWNLRDLFAPSLPIPVRLNHGGFFLAYNDDMGKLVCFCRAFEDGERRFVSQFLKAGMVVLDIGANQGLYTILASERVGSKGRVFAFEPVPEASKKLRRNLRLNRCQNVVVAPVAIGADEGLAKLFVCLGGRDCYSSLRRPPNERETMAIRVPITTLENYTSSRNIDVVDFVKLDVEGAERDVLRGAKRLFKKGCRPIVMCEFSDQRTGAWGYRARELYALLVAYSYEWFSVTSVGALCPSPPRDKYDDDNLNLVGVPTEKLDLVQAQLARS